MPNSWAPDIILPAVLLNLSSVYYCCLIINEAIAPVGVVSHFMRSYFLITPSRTTEFTIYCKLYTEKLKDGAPIPDTVIEDYEYDPNTAPD